MQLTRTACVELRISREDSRKKYIDPLKTRYSITARRSFLVYNKHNSTLCTVLST